MEKRFWAIIIIFIFIISSAIYMGFNSYDYYKEKAIEEDLCNQIDGCEKYNCLAELETIYNAQRNYLLQEQNCLLRENK